MIDFLVKTCEKANSRKAITDKPVVRLHCELRGIVVSQHNCQLRLAAYTSSGKTEPSEGSEQH